MLPQPQPQPQGAAPGSGGHFLSVWVISCLLPPPEKQVYRAGARPCGCFSYCHTLILTLGKSAVLPGPASACSLTTSPGLPVGRCQRGTGGHDLVCLRSVFRPEPGPDRTKRRGGGSTCPLPTHGRLPGGCRQQNPSMPGTSLKPLGIVLSREKKTAGLSWDPLCSRQGKQEAINCLQTS